MSAGALFQGKRRLSVNGEAASIEANGEQIAYSNPSGETLTADVSVQVQEPGTYAVILNGRSYRVVTDGVEDRQGLQLLVNGTPVRVAIVDPRSLSSSSGGAGSEGRQEITSLMPGKVVRILVAQGDAVEQGQGLIVVEAMKMQNEMKSPKSGTVAEIRVAPEATVGSGEVLIVIE